MASGVAQRTLRALAYVAACLFPTGISLIDSAAAVDVTALFPIEYKLAVSPEDVRVEPADEYIRVQIVKENQDSDPVRAGEPQLPVVVRWFILPDHCKVADLAVTTEDMVAIPGNCIPEPIPGDGEDPTPQDSGTYEQDGPYPGYTATLLRDTYIRGYHLAQVMIYPLQWLPSEKSLLLAPSVTLTLTLSPLAADQERDIFRVLRSDAVSFEYPDIESWVTSLVANSEGFLRPGLPGHPTGG